MVVCGGGWRGRKFRRVQGELCSGQPTIIGRLDGCKTSCKTWRQPTHKTANAANTASDRSIHRCQFGHGQSQPLHAVAAKVDLRTSVFTDAFERDDHALTKLVVKHVLP